MKRYIRPDGVKSHNVHKESDFKRIERKRLKAEKREDKRLRKLLKAKKPEPKRRTFVIDYYAEVLENNLPKSEQWFRELYLKEDIKRTFSEDLFKDQFNKSFNKTYIPDVCNMGYKYIIEVDGSIHNTPEQKFKDSKKDYYFKKRGYLVIRVKHGDNAGYKECVDKIKARVAEIDLIELERRKSNG